MDQKWPKVWMVLTLLGFCVVLTLQISGWKLYSTWEPFSTLELWGLLAGLTTLFFLGVGLQANRKWFGILIDVRNRVSLSRLQISLWTILVISAYLAIALSRLAPGVLKEPSKAEIDECQAAFLKNREGIENITQLRQKDPKAAAAAQERAMAHCTPSPLKIYFPAELLWALGISTASFAGSSLVQQIKRNKSDLVLVTELKRKMDEAENDFKSKEVLKNQVTNNLGDVISEKTQAEQDKKKPDRTPADLESYQQKIAKAEFRLPELTTQLTKAKEDCQAAKTVWETAKNNWETEDKKKEGLLKINESPQQANLVDLFQGDEIGNYQLIDLSKVQMFFFTVAILLTYGVALGGLLKNSAAVLAPFGVNLPLFSAELNALLAISHAGYLTVKSVDHTKTK